MTCSKTALSLYMVLCYVGVVHVQKALKQAVNPVKDVRVECRSEEILVTLTTRRQFDGMIYPKGLSKNSSCVSQYTSSRSPIRYTLSLKKCNTMSMNKEHAIEYFNTIVVQPHRKLVTNQGRGYQVRCTYRTRHKLIKSAFSMGDDKAELEHRDSLIGDTSFSGTAPMPECTMRIFRGYHGNDVDTAAFGGAAGDVNGAAPSASVDLGSVADSVRIGDALTLSVQIEKQPMYGLKVVDCKVRDGLGWGEYSLIDSRGCALETDIMGDFVYSTDKTRASVRFQAHKFPYTSSVYYQCNVALCLKADGGCAAVPPLCDSSGIYREKVRRTKRFVDDASVVEADEAKIEVFTGLNVEEGVLGDETGSGVSVRSSTQRNSDDDILCIAPRTFAIIIAIVGLFLTIAVLIAILVLIGRRRRNRKHLSTTGSSIYSGPYTNTAYSHSS